MKQFAVLVAVMFVAIFAACVAIIAGLWLSFRTPPAPQPKIGYVGNWRGFDAFGFNERPLPPATNLWREYEAWTPGTNQYTSRLYLARLGGADRQSNFRSHFSRGDTPMGAQDYTTVDFIYTDPTNGRYAITWTWRGKHETSFLRFDETYRLYQLQPYGTPADYPPSLSIRAIEGVRPEHARD